MSEALPQRLSFAGHETFSFRYSWLKKGLDHIKTFGGEAFNRESSIVELGVGKNMVKAIRYWCLVANVLEIDPSQKNNRGQSLSETRLGSVIFDEYSGGDPYLEDIGTVWLLHWEIANNVSRATTWYWAFNCLNRMEFTKKSLAEDLLKLAEDRRMTTSQSSIARDIDCFIRSYVQRLRVVATPLEDSLECPLAELGLIKELHDRHTYQFVYGAQDSLPIEVFIYCLIKYWRKNQESLNTETKTMSFEEIAFGSGGLGRVFKLEPNSLIERLESLEEVTRGKILYTESAGIKQLALKDVSVMKDPETWLHKYYQASSKEILKSELLKANA
jgi:hypothetical protein